MRSRLSRLIRPKTITKMPIPRNLRTSKTRKKRNSLEKVIKREISFNLLILYYLTFCFLYCFETERYSADLQKQTLLKMAEDQKKSNLLHHSTSLLKSFVCLYRQHVVHCLIHLHLTLLIPENFGIKEFLVPMATPPPPAGSRYESLRGLGGNAPTTHEGL